MASDDSDISIDSEYDYTDEEQDTSTTTTEQNFTHSIDRESIQISSQNIYNTISDTTTMDSNDSRPTIGSEGAHSSFQFPTTSPRRINLPPNRMSILVVNTQRYIEIVQEFKDLINTVQQLNPLYLNLKGSEGVAQVPNTVVEEQEVQSSESVVSPASNITTDSTTITEQGLEEDNSEKESHSSDDDVMTDKRTRAVALPSRRAPESAQHLQLGDWVTIGEGTLIHKEKYRKINWKSYATATRTLLRAIFSRKILATHCLTGKRSPAFKDKPAKMCLDPKTTADIILEVMRIFDVKENLVRGAITMKCADEGKMYKARRLKRQSRNNRNSPRPSTSADPRFK